MPKCQLCGYANRKRKQFFRCWNNETKTGCKRYTCHNCIFIIKETTNYQNFICPNSFCNEEFDANDLLGLKKWYEPKEKLDYEERVKLLSERETDIEKMLKKWEEKVSSATKRTVFASKKASESEKFLKHEFKQMDFNFHYGSLRVNQSFYPTQNLMGAFLTSIAFTTRDDILKYKPRLKLSSNGSDLLELFLTGEQQVFTLNCPIANTNTIIDAEIQLHNSSYQDEERDMSATLTLEFVGGK